MDLCKIGVFMIEVKPDNYPKKPFILIVDDVQENLQVLGNTLLELGYDIAVANNGDVALNIVDNDIPDLILLDVMMPVKNGYDTCLALKADSAAENIPVIFLTAKNETEDIIKGFQCGGVDYITKPFQREELLVRIKTHLDLKFYRDTLDQKNRELAEANAQNEHYLELINEKLKQAAEYVRSLLPNQMDDDRIATYWKFEPSSHLGGDSFGYHWIDERHFAMYLLDVCGHGIGSALHSVSALNVLKSQSLANTDYKDPASVLFSINNYFQMEDHNEMFFTMWYAVIDTETMKLKYSAGGHHEALLFDSSGNLQKLNAENLVVGCVPNYKFRAYETTAAKGSHLYVFSDGVYEIETELDTYLDLDAVTEFLQKKLSPADEDINSWFKEVRKILGERGLKDDFSILKVHFK